MTLLYSSSAPAAWNALPLELKEKFYAIASNGDWNAVEAFQHLVPKTLQDSVSEVQAWMDGYPTIGVADRDVSRIVSGANGGEYSTDNTIMEIASDNRARGAENITPAEMQEIEATNAADAEVIENFFTDDTVVGDVASTAGESIFGDVATTVAESTLLGDIAQGTIDGLLPAIGAYKVGTKVADQFDDPVDKWGYGSLSGGLAAALLMTPVGQIGAAAYGGYKLTQFGFKLYDRWSEGAKSASRKPLILSRRMVVNGKVVERIGGVF